jgi:hypothetical protein
MNADLEITVENALNAAVKVVQDSLGVTAGDFAGHYFSGTTGDNLKDILRDYMVAESQQLPGSIMSRLLELGLGVWSTGGGCECIGFERADGWQIMVTDADGSRLPWDRDAVMVGIYPPESGEHDSLRNFEPDQFDALVEYVRAFLARPSSLSVE